MTREQIRESDQIQQTALKLVRCLGSRAALSYCRSQQWSLLYDQVLKIDERLEARS